MTEGLIDAIRDFGYVGVLFLLIAESIFPPIPSELILPFAGYAASRGLLYVPAVVIVSVMGSVIGAQLLYRFGAWIGEDRIEFFIKKYGKYVLIKQSDYRKSLAWFHRYAVWAVFIGRLVPGVRSLISIPAGIDGMNSRTYLLLTAAGALIWNSLLIYSGFLLGENYEAVSAVMGRFSAAVIFGSAGVVALILFSRFVYKKRKARKQKAREQDLS